LGAHGGVVAIVGDNARAERLFERSLAAFNSVDDNRGIGHLLLRLGASALYRQDYERARRLAADSLAIAREVNDRRTQALALGLAGEVAYSAGDREAGLELVKQSAAFAGETGYTWQRARMLRRLADWALQRKDIDEGLSAARESLRLAQRTHDRTPLSSRSRASLRAPLTAAGGSRPAACGAPSKPKSNAPRSPAGRAHSSSCTPLPSMTASYQSRCSLTPTPASTEDATPATH
jgi:tetratricopeptide (TPR) repeat protein